MPCSACWAPLVVGGSVGENLNLSLYRVRGTLAGTLVGIALAYALGMSVWSLGLAVAALAWLCSGLGWGGAAMRVGIAMALVVLFTHTSDALYYAGLRVLNTLIGVTVGIAVGFLVWPVRGRDEIAGASDQALAATAVLLDALAGGASADALRPLQARLLDALSAVRVARKNAQLERQVDRDTEMLTTHTLLVARAAIAALGASVKLDELVHAGVRAECVQAVRHAIAPLAAYDVKNVTTSAHPAADFAARHESALREAAHPDLDPDARALLAAVLGELQQIHAAVQALRDTRS